MVRIFRTALPVVAILLAASIFVLSKSNKIREGLIIADAELAELAELAIGQKVTNPHFSGVTSKGDAFTILAEWALPDAPNPEFIDLNLPVTTIDFLDGSRLKSTSAEGRLNLPRNEATLTGKVKLETSNGYTADSDELLVNFETGNVLSPGPVHVKGPLGTIDAGEMELRQDLHKNQSGDKGVLLFNKGVKVLYIPPDE